MRSRRSPLVVVALVAAMTLAACSGGNEDLNAAEAGDTASETSDGDGSSDSDDASGDDDAQATGTVTYWHAYSEDSPEVQTLRDVIIPRFEEDHPGITIEQVPIPYDELRQKLITATAGDALPCLVRSDIIWVPELAELGVLVPLDEQMSDFDDIASRTFEGPVATTAWDGHHYGLPLNTNTRVLMYDAAVLADAGFDAPPATFDELEALADALEGSDRFAFADNGTSGWNLFPWIWSAGGSITDDAITQATGHLDSADSVAAVEMLVSLHDRGQIPDIMVGDQGGIATSDGLAQGTYATILDGPWMFPIFAGQYPDFELSTAPVPEGPGGSISVVGGEDLVLTTACDAPDAAMEVMRFLLGEWSQTEMAKVGQMSVLEDLDVTELQDYYGVFVDQLATARARTPHPQYPRIEEVLSTEVQRAFAGEVSVKDALTSAAQQIDELLAGS
jgi:multiple sugar transport system substrate-binding protein